jgi:hypothetical protein
VHGIGDVEAVGKLRRKRKPKDSDEMDFDTDEDIGEDQVVAAAPRSRRARPAVDYAALAGVDSDDFDARNSASDTE